MTDLLPFSEHVFKVQIMVGGKWKTDKGHGKDSWERACNRFNHLSGEEYIEGPPGYEGIQVRPTMCRVIDLTNKQIVLVNLETLVENFRVRMREYYDHPL